MVAKFDAEGAHTVPFQQCIDEEIRILGKILDWSLEFWQLKMCSRLFEPGIQDGLGLQECLSTYRCSCVLKQLTLVGDISDMSS